MFFLLFECKYMYNNIVIIVLLMIILPIVQIWFASLTILVYLYICVSYCIVCVHYVVNFTWTFQCVLSEIFIMLRIIWLYIVRNICVSKYNKIVILVESCWYNSFDLFWILIKYKYNNIIILVHSLYQLCLLPIQANI